MSWCFEGWRHSGRFSLLPSLPPPPSLFTFSASLRPEDANCWPFSALFVAPIRLLAGCCRLRLAGSCDLRAGRGHLTVRYELQVQLRAVPTSKARQKTCLASFFLSLGCSRLTKTESSCVPRNESHQKSEQALICCETTILISSPHSAFPLHPLSTFATKLRTIKF